MPETFLRKHRDAWKEEWKLNALCCLYQTVTISTAGFVADALSKLPHRLVIPAPTLWTKRFTNSPRPGRTLRMSLGTCPSQAPRPRSSIVGVRLGLFSCNSGKMSHLSPCRRQARLVEDRLTYLRADSVSSTGNFNIITLDHMKKMMNNVIVRNIGHFDNAMDLTSMELGRHESRQHQASEDLFAFPVCPRWDR